MSSFSSLSVRFSADISTTMNIYADATREFKSKEISRFADTCKKLYAVIKMLTGKKQENKDLFREIKAYGRDTKSLPTMKSLDK